MIRQPQPRPPGSRSNPIEPEKLFGQHPNIAVRGRGDEDVVDACDGTAVRPPRGRLDEVRDDLRLLAVDPAREGGEEELKPEEVRHHAR